MKKSIRVSVLMGIVLTVIGAGKTFAEDRPEIDLGDVVVSATKVEQYQAQVSSSTTVIGSEQLRLKGNISVADVLRTVPGVQIAQSGPNGGVTYAYIRGAKAEHTLVLIDGVEVNDPFSAERSFDFAHLSTANIERIEIVRGNQTSLYGADAIGGVINIITKRGGNRPSVNAAVTGGSHNSFALDVGASGGGDRHNYSLAVSRYRSGGISQARGGSEHDGYENTTVSARAGVPVGAQAELSASLRYTDAEADIDDAAFDDDPNYTADSEQLSGTVQWRQRLSEVWEQRVELSGMTIERHYRDPDDGDDPFDDYDDTYKADYKKAGWQHNFSLGDNDVETVGCEYEQERGGSESNGAWAGRIDRRTLQNRAVYLQQQLEVTSRWSTLLGMRVDDHSRFGDKPTYRLGTVYSLFEAGPRLKANVATGFKAPTLYQLFSNYGNPELQPDKSRSYDIGIEQSALADKLFCKLTYFHNSFRSMVDFDLMSSKYINIARAETSGLESEVSAQLNDGLRLSGTYTYLNAEDKDTGRDLARRPRNSAAVSADWQCSHAATVLTTVRYSGSRFSDPTNLTKLKQYAVVDLSGTYALSDSIELFGRVENLLDKRYEEVDGYNTLGQAFSAGIRGTW